MNRIPSGGHCAASGGLCGARTGLVMLAVALAPAPASGQARRVIPAELAARLKAYPTPAYVIYTDIQDQDTVREAALRMTCMAIEYHRRCAGSGRAIRERLPFFLFSDADDFLAAGGMQGATGLYTGDKLIAIAGKNPGNRLWKVVQHEGFHQYVHKVVTGRIPIWVNEGMAEYFGYGVWTGDSFVVGVIPPERLAHLRGLIESNQIVPFLVMMEMSSQEWSLNLSVRNYTQAWAMVHFLAHADNDKYQERFRGFISDISRGAPWKEAFIRRFGRDVEAFQKRFCEWWMSQPKNPTADLYNAAVTHTLVSFLARAGSQGQRFADMDEFFDVARQGKLREDPRRWLPKTLLQDALREAGNLKEWKLLSPQATPRIQLSTPDGTVLTGSFRGGSGASVDTQVTIKHEPKPKPPAASSRPK